MNHLTWWVTFGGLRGRRIVLDEIHRLQSPSELLKIAADHYPRMYVVATGSSTLGASKKFRDTLAGRKRDLWLTPMCLPDLDDAKRTDFGKVLPSEQQEVAVFGIARIKATFRDI